MLARHPSPPCRHWLALGAHAWVVLVLVLGALVSSLGQVRSHGLAAMAVAQHTDHGDHGHVHETDELEGEVLSGDTGHVHHNHADHSHDKAHALPSALPWAALAVPVWRPLTHPLRAGRTVPRLERPPMA